MTKETILALVNAGFTKAEILKYFSESEQQVQIPAPAPTAAPTPTPTPAPAPAQPEIPSQMQSAIDEMRNLIAQAQGLNLLGVNTPTPQPVSGEDAFASLIDPPKVSN